jgi:PAS domain S-box-containing protein
MSIALPDDFKGDEAPPGTAGLRTLKRMQSCLALFALGAGATALVGWFWDIHRLTDWFNTGITIKVNGALGAVAAGLALLPTSPSVRFERAGRMLGLLVAGLGGLTLLQHMTNWNLGIDELLVKEVPGARATTAPGRMGPPASLSYLLIGTGLLLPRSRSVQTLRAVLAITVLGISLLSLTGYLYGAEFLYSAPRLTGISAQTAMVIFSLGLAILIRAPEQNPVRLLLERSAAGLLARRLLPIVFLLPLALGWLRIAGQELNWYDAAFGTAIRTVVEIALLAGLLWWVISHVKAYEDASRTSDRRVADTLASITDGFVAFDSSWRYIYVNDEAARLLNRSKLELLGNVAWELFPEAVGSVAHQQLLVAARSRQSVEFQDFTPAINRWLSWKAYPTADGGMATYFQDISDRKQVEARQEFLSQLAAATQPLVNSDEITATAARMLREHLECDRCAYAVIEDESVFVITGDDGRDVPTIVGRWPVASFGQECFRCMLHNESYVVDDTDSDSHISAEDLAAYRAAAIRSVICVPLHKDGRLTAAMAVHQRTPRTWTLKEIELVQQVVSRCWESLERARVTRELQESEASFRQLANSIPQLAWMARPDGALYWFNDRWYEYTGATPEQVDGWNWQSVINSSALDSVVARWKQSVQTGSTFDITVSIRGNDGSYRPFLTRAVALRDEHGEIARWFGTNTDVSEREMLEEERRQLLEVERAARAEAERIGRMKDEFLATLSHELRTPLNAILGYATLLRMGEFDAQELSDAAAIIERNAYAQAKIIEDLLDMNRIVAGKIRLEMQLVSLHKVIDAALETVKSSAKAKGIRLNVHFDSARPALRGDPSRLQQVVWNLLSNAVKFTGKGGSIDVYVTAPTSNVEISVIDSGDGISPEFLPFVFDRFRQADSSITRRQGGLGLGAGHCKAAGRSAWRHGRRQQRRSGPGRQVCCDAAGCGRRQPRRG